MTNPPKSNDMPPSYDFMGAVRVLFDKFKDVNDCDGFQSFELCEALTVIAVQLAEKKQDAQAVMDERAAFEAYTLGIAPRISLKKFPEGSYFNEFVDKSWDAWQARAALSSAQVAADRPVLRDGEIYVGRINAEHVILLPGDNKRATWQKQMDWAKSLGGDLPNRIEQAMLFANFRDQFDRADCVAYWTNQTDADPVYESWAWCQYFGNGDQISHIKYAELRARAVRRVAIDALAQKGGAE